MFVVCPPSARRTAAALPLSQLRDRLPPRRGRMDIYILRRPLASASRASATVRARVPASVHCAALRPALHRRRTRMCARVCACAGVHFHAPPSYCSTKPNLSKRKLPRVFRSAVGGVGWGSTKLDCPVFWWEDSPVFFAVQKILLQCTSGGPRLAFAL